MKEQLLHPFPPLYDSNSRVLILGSFPSVKSREQMFFYGHPQNRFWKVMSAVLQHPVPQSIPEKRSMLLSHGVALWDSICRCDITGSSDASIENIVPNDLSRIFSAAKILQIFCNGKKSWEIYNNYIEPVTGISAACLPSTSPANAAWSLERLIAAWSGQIQPFLDISSQIPS